MQNISSTTSAKKDKKGKFKYVADGMDGTELMDALEQMKCDFIVRLSNYTTRIVAPEFNIYHSSKIQPKSVFAAFAKLKSHLKNTAPPDIRKEELVYYNHSLKRDIEEKTVMNIDIKAAYTSVLFNDGFIDEKMYKYIMRLNKDGRLACIGMLAARKEIYNCVAGDMQYIGEDVSPFAPFFYHAVHRTYKIMMNVKNILGRRHLFTWVDGIYFKANEELARECTEYLASVGLKSTLEILTDFKANILDDIIIINFYKGAEKRIFRIPLLDARTTSAILTAISKFKNNKNETVQVRNSDLPGYRVR